MRKEDFILSKEYIIFLSLIFIMLIFAVGKRENTESKYKEIIDEKILKDEKIEKLAKDISKKQEELEAAQLELVKLKSGSKESAEAKLGKIKISNFNDEIELGKNDKNRDLVSLGTRKNTSFSSKKIEIGKDKNNYSVNENIVIGNKKLSLEKSDLTNKMLNLSKIKNYKILWPVDSENITSEFGDRYHPVLKQMKFHRGIDIAGKKGETVRASFNGIVTFAGEKGEYGYMVELERDDGLRVRYAHLDKMNVVVNQLVSEGEKIGEVGNTGMTTGAHLHFEIIIDSIPVNPLKFKYFK